MKVLLFLISLLVTQVGLASTKCDLNESDDYKVLDLNFELMRIHTVATLSPKLEVSQICWIAGDALASSSKVFENLRYINKQFKERFKRGLKNELHSEMASAEQLGKLVYYECIQSGPKNRFSMSRATQNFNKFTESINKIINLLKNSCNILQK
jgi:hypothetical protein